jgi:hypothetical protein
MDAPHNIKTSNRDAPIAKKMPGPRTKMRLETAAKTKFTVRPLPYRPVANLAGPEVAWGDRAARWLGRAQLFDRS